jgi:hypothetical protein
LIGETSAERALGRELRYYRRRAARLLLAGFVLLGFGIVLAFFFTPSKRLSTDKDFARRSGDEMTTKLRKAGKLTHNLRVELNGMLAFFQAEAKEAYIVEIKPSLVLLLTQEETEMLPEPTIPMTVFHPGVMHNHQPSGKWAEIQAEPNSSQIGLSTICRHFDPENVMFAAGLAVLKDKPIAAYHLGWFYRGGGADYDENSNLDLMLRTDSGVQRKLATKIPTGQASGKFTDYVTITQDNYDDEEFKFAFGEIDRLDFEVDFSAGTLHAWFLDRYEWHPVYPVYPKSSGDIVRPTNCLHAAAVELKSGTARDYWMKGEVTIPLKALRTPAYRWHDPAISTR